MSIVPKHPPLIESVGAQYFCFGIPTESEEWQPQFEAEVEKTKTVKTVKVTENKETTDVRASGEVYDSDDSTASMDIEVQVVAMPADTRAKARGDKIDEGGLIQAGGKTERPYFAYGKTVYLKGGKKRFDWFPKCKLVENSDEANTREEKFSEQTENLKIRAYPFDGKTNYIKNSVDETMPNYPAGLTEDKFFNKPVVTVEDLAEAVGP